VKCIFGVVFTIYSITKVNDCLERLLIYLVKLIILMVLIAVFFLTTILVMVLIAVFFLTTILVIRHRNVTPFYLIK
ncbi:hypothetical protein P4597_00005, partial [Peribacillus simplex]|uniref:hypothetical protein n=1 Tax=Peribacillus simplex TaxID=1478 RepID=UPI002E211778|nr:hypothetical protein [Peribacillus simplex]